MKTRKIVKRKNKSKKIQRKKIKNSKSKNYKGCGGSLQKGPVFFVRQADNVHIKEVKYSSPIIQNNRDTPYDGYPLSWDTVRTQLQKHGLDILKDLLLKTYPEINKPIIWMISDSIRIITAVSSGITRETLLKKLLNISTNINFFISSKTNRLRRGPLQDLQKIKGSIDVYIKKLPVINIDELKIKVSESNFEQVPYLMGIQDLMSVLHRLINVIIKFILTLRGNDNIFGHIKINEMYKDQLLKEKNFKKKILEEQEQGEQKEQEEEEQEEEKQEQGEKDLESLMEKHENNND
jgi:hypothetical protein